MESEEDRSTDRAFATNILRKEGNEDPFSKEASDRAKRISDYRKIVAGGSRLFEDGPKISPDFLFPVPSTKRHRFPKNPKRNNKTRQR